MTTTFRQDTFNLLLLRLYDNGSDTQGQLFYKDINGGVRYVFSFEPPAGERLLPGQYELRLCRFGESFESYCRHKDGFIRSSAYKYGIITAVGKFTPVFCIERGKWPKCIIVGDRIENNSKGEGKIEEVPRAYAFLLSSIYRAFEESKLIFLHIMNCDKGIKDQFTDGKRYGSGKLF